MTVIYLMGRGHSGSTFLDIAFGTADGVESVGELVSGLSRGGSEPCSCGVASEACPFWSQMRAIYGPSLQQDAISLFDRGGIRSFLNQLLRPNSPVSVEGQGLTRKIYEKLGEVAEGRILFDSNKNLERAATVLNIDDTNIVVYLVRDPVSVLSSYHSRQVKGRNLKFLRREFSLGGGIGRVVGLSAIALAWSVTSVLAALVSRMHPGRVILIEFEEFLENPIDALALLGGLVGVDMADAAHKLVGGTQLNPGHNIGGNETRFAGTKLVFDRDKATQISLPTGYRLLAVVLSVPGRFANRLLFAGPRV